MENKPLCGIVVPYYKQSQYIDAAITSAVAQDYPNKILCICDDCSNDGVFERLTAEMGDDFSLGGVPTILIKNDTNKGVSYARNLCIQTLVNNGAKYLAMLDADDWWLPGKLSRMIPIMEEDQTIGLAYHDIIIHNQETNTDSYEYREPYTRNRLEQEYICSNSPISSALAIQQCGWYDPSLQTCEDYDLAIRITQKFMAVHVPIPLAAYRVTPQGTTFTVKPEIWQKNWQIIHQRIQQQRGSH
jgi:glycosyltransferase involved in cell wall biosynthesis